MLREVNSEGESLRRKQQSDKRRATAHFRLTRKKPHFSQNHDHTAEAGEISGQHRKVHTKCKISRCQKVGWNHAQRERMIPIGFRKMAAEQRESTHSKFNCKIYKCLCVQVELKRRQKKAKKIPVGIKHGNQSILKKISESTCSVINKIQKNMDAVKHGIKG